MGPILTVFFFTYRNVRARTSYLWLCTQCVVDRFTNELFWNFKKCRTVSMEAYPYKQMSEKKFFPKVAPSPGSGPLLLAGAVAVQGVGGWGWRFPIGRELKIEASHWSRGHQEKNLRL